MRQRARAAGKGRVVDARAAPLNRRCPADDLIVWGSNAADGLAKRVRLVAFVSEPLGHDDRS